MNLEGKVGWRSRLAPCQMVTKHLMVKVTGSNPRSYSNKTGKNEKWENERALKRDRPENCTESRF